MDDPTDADLLRLFVSLLAALRPEVAFHGPCLSDAGWPEPVWDPTRRTLRLDFTLAEFGGHLDGMHDHLVRRGDRLPFPELPIRERAVRLTVLGLRYDWVGRLDGSRHRMLTLSEQRPWTRLQVTPLRLGQLVHPWYPPVSRAFADEMRGPAEGHRWSIDQLDRFVWLLAGRRQLQRFGLLGCWVRSAASFVCVLRPPTGGPFGIVVEASGDVGARVTGNVDPVVRASVESVVQLDLDRVEQWRERGWILDGIAFDRDPAGLITPWQGGRPPEPGDDLVRPDVSASWSGFEPSLHPDPWIAGRQDASSAEHALWASRLAAHFVIHDSLRDRLRTAALWVVAPDCCVVIESHEDLPQGRRSGAPGVDVAGMLEPGQHRVRIGELFAPRDRTHSSTELTVITRHSYELALSSWSAYDNIERTHGRRGGVWWSDHTRRSAWDRISVDPASQDRMAVVVRHALDDRVEEVEEVEEVER